MLAEFKRAPTQFIGGATAFIQSSAYITEPETNNKASTSLKIEES